jgi:flagellar biosynthesis/type III secretory pathway M-ring protein FliF/YscJ
MMLILILVIVVIVFFIMKAVIKLSSNQGNDMSKKDAPPKQGPNPPKK